MAPASRTGGLLRKSGVGVLAWEISAHRDEDHGLREIDALLWDCQDFRVWPGIMGNKESHYVTTQRTCHTE
jgi:hypothetical protein